MYRLVIGEKPSQAKAYAAVLGANERKDGFFIGGGYIVAWCYGHLLELAAPAAYGEQYIKWRYADLPVLPQEWLHVASKSKTAQLKILKELIKRADVECVINACDAGREGELIFRLVYESVKGKKPIKRLWISSMEDAAIRDGFANLKDGKAYDPLYSAASCREKADWLVGINTTRLFSVLYGATLNSGRVQSPTLAMLVRREADINAFVKEPFYTPCIDCGFIASGERHDSLADAEAIRTACDGQTAAVVSVERIEKSSMPPKLYDLTTLQRDANRLLGFTAQQTLEYAQSLYEKKLLSYPRTDSRYLTEDMRDTVSAMVMWLGLHLPYLKNCRFTPNVDRMLNTGKVTDHHAIIPTAEISRADLLALPSGERDILNLVSSRLFCASAPVHVYEEVTVSLDCGGNSFSAKGKTVLADGWKAVEGAFKNTLKAKPDDDEDGDENTALPELAEGEIFHSVTVTIREGATTPPKHFTEDALLSAMENAGSEDMPEDAERRGLGTPATRAATIEKLIKAGFVARSKKNMLPTDKGKSLVAVLPETITSPKLTAEWEYQLKQIERGKVSADEFMSGIAKFVSDIVIENSLPKPEFAGLFKRESRAAAKDRQTARRGSSVK